jgi:AcrR family transcriptional regulator
MNTKGEQTKTFIIEKAAPIFNKKGVAGTSMSDIMEATKLAKGSLYNHFESKEVLVNAAVDHNIDILRQRISTSLAGYVSNHEKLIAYIDIFKNPINASFDPGCPMMNFSGESADTNPVLKHKVDRFAAQIHTLIAGLVESGISQQEFKPSWNSNEFATIAFSMIQGGIMTCKTAGNNDKMQIINTYLKNIINENIL